MARHALAARDDEDRTHRRNPVRLADQVPPDLRQLWMLLTIEEAAAELCLDADAALGWLLHRGLVRTVAGRPQDRDREGRTDQTRESGARSGSDARRQGVAGRTKRLHAGPGPSDPHGHVQAEVVGT